MDEPEESQTTVDPLVGLPRVGQVVADKYEIKKLVGVGGMGVVLQAWHQLLEQEVAIKVLLPALGADREALKRFEREARTVVRLKSEHVTRVLDVGRLPNGIPYMVMEFLEGLDLAELITVSSPLVVQEAIDRVLQIAEALAEAHSLGIVHRDLKPENVFVVQRPDGSACAKVLDFGLSKAPSTGERDSRPSRPLTGMRQVMGTPNYMSPEQWESAHDVGPETDQWALGAILYELLTGSPAFGGTELGPLCAKISLQSPPAPRELRPDMPEALERAILRTLEKDSSNRFPSLFELARAIAPFGSKNARLTLQRIGGVLRPGEPLDLPATAAAPAAQSTPTLAAESAHGPIGTLPTAPAWDVDIATVPKPRISPVITVGIIGVLVVLSFIALISLLWPDVDPTEQLPDAETPAAPDEPISAPKSSAPKAMVEPTPSTSVEPSTDPTNQPTAAPAAPPSKRPPRPPTGKRPAKPIDLFGPRH